MNTELTYWYNDIPKHWRIQELKYLCSTIGSGTTPNSGDDDFYPDEGGIHFLQTGDLNDGIVENTAKRISDVAVNKFGLRTYPKGSLVVAMYGATIGKLGILNFDTTVNQACCVIKTRQANIKYLFYALSASKPLLVLEAKGGGQPNINQDTLRNWRLLLPPIAYQQKIANYLDNKISNIDAYVSERTKERLLLSDLKKAKVAETVTKGLSSNIPLKDSGIPSIGMIPAHWEVRRLKDVCTCNDETLSDNFDSNTLIKYVEISDVTDGQGITNISELLFSEAPSRARRITQVNDIIVSTVRTYLKAIARVTENDLIVSTGFAVLRPKKILSSYLHYLMTSSNILCEIIKQSTGTGYPAITSARIMELSIPVPPIDEQLAIASYLNHECEQIEKKCALIDEQIQQLQLLKRALINEVVTGKKAI